MKKIIDRIRENYHFLLFILLFAYVHSIYIRIIARQKINVYTFTPEAAVSSLMVACMLFMIILYFIRKWQKSVGFKTKTLMKIFGASLLVFVVSMLMIEFLFALTFGNLERNFNTHSLMIVSISHSLDGLIYGSFFLAYYYFQDNKKYQKRLADYDKSLAESKINQLKTQLNPHFLFNNLNVLDQLIEEDQSKASDFLNEFAEIYRYVLQSTEKELVRLEEEIEFTRQYFKLVQHKYESAYQLKIENKKIEGFIIPMTLQLLLENAVQHNLASQENPIRILIKIDNAISVSNNINLKRNNKPASGRGLKNLNEQYALISKMSIDILQTENTFSVVIPIIYEKNA